MAAKKMPQDVVGTVFSRYQASKLEALKRRRAATDAVERKKHQLMAIRPEGWRSLWPQITDYEKLFFDAFTLLRPDLIHVHDRHPMAGAQKYTMLYNAEHPNKPPVKWVYDAHEWLPGQVFSPPARHGAGWITSEKDLMRGANSIITVSPELADNFRKTHRLTRTPGVVVNAPRKGAWGTRDAGRIDIRTDAGVPETAPLAVYVGAIAERRGVLTMVESLQYLPEMHVAYLAARDPRSREMIRNKALELGVGMPRFFRSTRLECRVTPPTRRKGKI
ncbi:hypothetical protein C1Y63_12420, partial [Corynebacterium sp. 13CS0277]|uniref:glycosyltransferase n=1 Tax=Corynebacterium sp. 13CS0277 TaxID=2071994 RepID=UPI000D425CA6